MRRVLPLARPMRPPPRRLRPQTRGGLGLQLQGPRLPRPLAPRTRRCRRRCGLLLGDEGPPVDHRVARVALVPNPIERGLRLRKIRHPGGLQPTVGARQAPRRRPRAAEAGGQRYSVAVMAASTFSPAARRTGPRPVAPRRRHAPRRSSPCGHGARLQGRHLQSKAYLGDAPDLGRGPLASHTYPRDHSRSWW